MRSISIKANLCVFYSVLLCILFSNPSFAEVVLVDGTDFYRVTKEIELFEDSTEKLTIDQVLKPPYSSLFQKRTIPYLYNPSEKVYYARLTVKNQRSSENQSWYFESWGFDIDEIEFFVPDDSNGFFETKMGYFKDFNERKIWHKNFLFLITLKPNEVKSYYIKFKRHHPMHLNFIIRTHEKFIGHAVKEYLLLGIFYGILGFILLLNLYLLVSLKERIYFFYLVYIFSEAFYCTGRDGLGFQFLWPSHPWINYLTNYCITEFFFTIASFWYSIEFLELRNKAHSKLYNLMVVIIIVRSLIFAICIVWPISPFSLFIIDSISLFIPFGISIYLLKNGQRNARFFVLAFSFLYFSFLLIILNERQILAWPSWYFINYGMLLEAIFFAIALIDNIKLLRDKNKEVSERAINQLKENQKLKDEINLGLEQKVWERASQIQTIINILEDKNFQLGLSNKKLEEVNNQITEMNLMLAKDNETLKIDLSSLKLSRVLLQNVTFEEFKRAFPDDTKCLDYLSGLKWENGFVCRKCGYKKGTKGRTQYTIRCKNCKYEESATSYTLFHKLKFPILKAFYLIYLLQTKNGSSMSIDELSSFVDLRRETCWSFKQKILQAEAYLSKHNIKDEMDGWGKLVLVYIPE